MRAGIGRAMGVPRVSVYLGIAIGRSCWGELGVIKAFERVGIPFLCLCGAFRNACICLVVISLQGGASLALDFS